MSLAEARASLDILPADILPDGARAGRLGCACPEDDARPLRRLPGEGTLLGGFALVVLAQALTLGALPLAGGMVAVRPEQAAWPIAAFLLGAAFASLPASFLLDAFGRRAGFALGASLGVAGGLMAAYGLVERAFPLLLLGAGWLGAAQGFGLFYRHAAAFGAGAGARSGAVARLLAAGALAGLVGPLGAGFAEALFVPYTLVGTLMLATLAQLGALAFAVALPEARFSHAGEQAGEGDVPARPPLQWRALIFPTATAAAAWAAMTATMVGAPLALADCGIAVPGIAGLVAWHVVAMYAPALAGGAIAARIGANALALVGAALAIAAALASAWAPDAMLIGGAFLVVGAGWSLAMVGATAALHRAGRPGRLQLGLHDAALLAAALAGALMF